jgi:hypothetical protein
MHATVEAGEIAVAGVYEGGVELDRTVHLGPGPVLLTLDVDASLGRIALYRTEEP